MAGGILDNGHPNIKPGNIKPGPRLAGDALQKMVNGYGSHSSKGRNGQTHEGVLSLTNGKGGNHASPEGCNHSGTNPIFL
jgi:hypothetical protein